MVDYFAISMICVWYCSNIGVLLLNKYLLSVWGFRYPIFLTMLHMLSCFILSIIVRCFGNSNNRQQIKSRKHMLKIAVLAIVFVISVVGGNISLKFIPVSFNQAIGATTPFFTAMLSLIILRKKETTEVYMTLVPVVIGIVLASNSEPLFNIYGFIACLIATFARALKSVLQGLLLTSETEHLDSLNLLLFMSPFALAILVISAFTMERNAWSAIAENFEKSSLFTFTLTLNCLIAYLVNLSNFLVTKCTSPLTLQVLGNAKGAVAVIVSILIFRNPVSIAGMIGYTITAFG